MKQFIPHLMYFSQGGAKTRMIHTPMLTPYLYYDLTEYYKSKYPEAGVKAVVVSYTIEF